MGSANALGDGGVPGARSDATTSRRGVAFAGRITLRGFGSLDDMSLLLGCGRQRFDRLGPFHAVHLLLLLLH